MDYMGYFEVPSFQHFSKVNELLETIGLTFSDSGFYYRKLGNELLQKDSEDYFDIKRFESSFLAGEGKIAQWYSDEVELSLSAIALENKKYVLFSLSDRNLAKLGRSFGGKEELIHFFIKFYTCLNAYCGFLSTETYEYDMIDESKRNEFIEGVFLAINPSEIDTSYLTKIRYFDHQSFGDIKYYERITEDLYT